MMQSYKYKRNLIDADLLDHYHKVNPIIPVYDIKYALQTLHKTTWGQLHVCMARLWPNHFCPAGRPICKWEGLHKNHKNHTLPVPQTKYPLEICTKTNFR